MEKKNHKLSLLLCKRKSIRVSIDLSNKYSVITFCSMIIDDALGKLPEDWLFRLFIQCSLKNTYNEL